MCCDVLDRIVLTDQIGHEEEDVLVCLVVFHSYGLFGRAIALVCHPPFCCHAC